MSTYDVQMIRDFLNHLLWELRLAQFENTARKGVQNPELIDQVRRYADKYNTHLLAVDLLRKGGASAEQIAAAEKVIRAKRATLLDEQVNHLECLAFLFEEALLCATHALQKQVLTREFDAATFPLSEGVDRPQQA